MTAAEERILEIIEGTLAKYSYHLSEECKATMASEIYDELGELFVL